MGGPACYSLCVYLDWDLERGEGHFWYVSCMQKLRPVLAKFRTCLNLASPKHPPCCFKCNQGLYLYKFQNVAYALYKTR